MTSPEELLHQVWGFAGFRPGQEEIVQAVTLGEPTLAIMPTGGGKSLCFQLPALCRQGVTVVISPLIALMRDQVRSLREAGVEAGALTSGNTGDETEEVFRALDEGRLKLLYLAPERLALPGTVPMLKRVGVSLIAVDEAHCVSQWGHDFRPDYLRIGQLRRDLGVPLAAFTATADAETRAEIVTRLFDGEPPRTFLRGFDRPNIRLCFAVKDSPREQVLTYVADRKGQSGIIYCGSRNKCEVLAQALRAAGHPAIHYHAGMDPEERRQAELRFQQEDGLIVVATVAFGMGIDKPDIRWVVHADLPKSVEGYYQEIGRAGRDGGPADTLTLYGPEDIRLRRSQIDEGAAPVERKEADHGRLNALLGLAEATGCRRQVLLSYFGEDSQPCGNCDLCERPARVFDATEAVRKALSVVLRTGQRFGAGYLIDVLTGNATSRIKEKGHDQLPTFAVGRDLSKPAWNAVFRQMMGRDLLRPDPEQNGGLYMTEAARPVLRGEVQVTLRADTVEKAQGYVSKATSQVAEDDQALLSALKAKRRALAEAQGVPAYVIFADRTLMELAEKKPRTLDEMFGISGIGMKKLESYGAAFLQVINGASDLPSAARRKLVGSQAGPIFDRLHEAQLALSRGEDGTGKYLSCTDTTLRHIAERRPSTLAELYDVQGMGEQKVERFGEAFLEILNAR